MVKKVRNCLDLLSIGRLFKQRYYLSIVSLSFFSDFRERETSIYCSPYLCVHWLISTTSVSWDDSMTSWTTSQGPTNSIFTHLSEFCKHSYQIQKTKIQYTQPNFNFRYRKKIQYKYVVNICIRHIYLKNHCLTKICI